MKGVVDFAVLSEEIIDDLDLFDGHLIDLTEIDLSENDFKELFYNSIGFEDFFINASSLNKNLIKFECQTYKDATDTEISFNLIYSIFNFYQEDLKVTLEDFDPCTVINVKKQLSELVYLSDICNVKCQLKWSQIICALKSFGGNLTAGNVNLLRINALFTNSNPNVKDIMIRFNFNVALENDY